MVLGGLIIKEPELNRVSQALLDFRKETGMHAELKWTKVTNQFLPKYRRFIDYFFQLNTNDTLHFQSIIIDNHAVDHKKYNKGDKELSFYKFYYQLLLNCFGRTYGQLADSSKFIVHLDHRTSSYPLGALKVILNRGMRKKFGIISEPFRSIQPHDSKQFDLMQLNDLLIGAIGFQKNGYDLLPDTRKAKIELAAYIAEQAGLTDLKDDTLYRQTKFKIWNFKLKK